MKSIFQNSFGWSRSIRSFLRLFQKAKNKKLLLLLVFYFLDLFILTQKKRKKNTSFSFRVKRRMISLILSFLPKPFNFLPFSHWLLVFFIKSKNKHMLVPHIFTKNLRQKKNKEFYNYFIPIYSFSNFIFKENCIYPSTLTS